MVRDIHELEEKLLQIYYKLNLGQMLKKNPIKVVINSFSDRKLSDHFWEATDTDLLIRVDEEEEDLDFVMEYVSMRLIDKAVISDPISKTLRFMRFLFWMQVLSFVLIGILMFTVWLGNATPQFISFGISAGSYFLCGWWFFRWLKQKRELVGQYIDEIRPIYLFPDKGVVYTHFILGCIDLVMLIPLEFFFQLVLLLIIIFTQNG